ncbi:hypothetical protein RDI58_001817 [Solanum bulbocastanum]|uniref:Uncharacterized protein n=1 Tax=Solanum bulbocastanum TaxID=147425 RepID=A0AAN8UA94_SOLBU
MTQKANLFKGQQKKKSVPSRHGKAPQIRKGKRAVKPSKNTKQMDVDRLNHSVGELRIVMTLELQLIKLNHYERMRTGLTGAEKAPEWNAAQSVVHFGFIFAFPSDLLGISSHVLFRYLAQELTKFINQCNETKAATFATKDGGQLCILKKPESSSKKPESSSKKPESSSGAAKK